MTKLLFVLTLKHFVENYTLIGEKCEPACIVPTYVYILFKLPRWRGAVDIASTSGTKKTRVQIPPGY
jgi:hypothetical protein